MPRAENLQAWRVGQGIGGIRRSDVAARGAAGKFARVEWKGVKELQAQLREFVAHCEGTGRLAAIRAIDEVVKEPAEFLRDTIKTRQQGSRWPTSVIAATFAATDLSNRQGKKRMALVGVPTGSPRGKYPDVRSASNPKGIFVEWGKRSGKKVGMSLARIFESGTRKHSARPAVEQAKQQAGLKAIQMLGEGYREVLQQFQRM